MPMDLRSPLGVPPAALPSYLAAHTTDIKSTTKMTTTAQSGNSSTSTQHNKQLLASVAHSRMRFQSVCVGGWGWGCTCIANVIINTMYIMPASCTPHTTTCHTPHTMRFHERTSQNTCHPPIQEYTTSCSRLTQAQALVLPNNMAFQRVWWNKTRGMLPAKGGAVSLWRPQPPPGYFALGRFCVC